MIDLRRLGAGMLAASPLLTQLSSERWLWWCGVTFAILGPLFLAFKK